MNMSRSWAASVLLVLLALCGCRSEKPTPITQEELVRREQAMMDAVVPGDKRPWQDYLADDVIYFDEKGRLHDKTSLINDVSPLPTGYSGTIKIVRPKSHIEGNIAILSYDSDETETIFGQNLTARYHTTDTWMNRNGRWQIVAGQVLRYYEDPAEGQSNPKKFGDFTATYELAPGVTRTVTLENGTLSDQRVGRSKMQLIAESGDLFFRKGVEGRILFHRDNRGKVDQLIDRRNNEDVVWKKL
jgi:hypothetical protein